ncbi:MAG: adenylate/guanylate cyclase domain-containing protein [Myxococcales bacterium]|nr:adenylate/guanylate cyclase domain-containing protein [Myxococcales bacterium]
MRLSLSLKFALLSALLVVLVAGATTFVLVFRFRQARERAMVDRDRELAKVLAGLRDARGQPDFGTLTAFVARSDKVDIGLVYALSIDSDGKLLQGALNPTVFGRLHPSFRAALARGQKDVLARLAQGKLRRRGKIKEYDIGGLHLGFDFTRIDARIHQQSRVGLLILGAGLLIGVLGALFLARRMARPIRQLASAMEAVAAGNMQQTVEVHSSDELASLAGSFNRMMRALRETRGKKQDLAPYVDPAVLERLTREEAPLEMVPEERPVTVLSAALVESGDRPARAEGPRTRLSLLNDHLAPVVDAIAAEGGVIVAVDDIGITAVWGAPFDVSDPELCALRAALAAVRGVGDEARRQALTGAPTWALRVGVATGRAACGNVGSQRRVSFGVVGEPRDAAREIALTCAAPGEVLVTEATRTKIEGRAEARPGPPLFLEGYDEAFPLYRVSTVL